MSTSIDQRKFLADAAESLSLSSPSTAAYLLATHTQILYEESKPLTSRQTEHYCGACGSIRQAQWTQKTEIKPRKTAAGSGGATVYRCLRCRRRTVSSHKKAAPTKPIPRATASPHLPVTTPVGASSPQTSRATSDSADPPSSNAADNVSSKKRAKARKHGGLQALLASKQRSQASSSLDLLDFLNQA
ncbi:hypothetical protein N7510_007926 [Penicillium lagena]|uniref:uncharacterized protein n=1 Tax=Penicillium lagena TaxID=94218 RepID=UPI0025412261|nr:uncharacterized protein N7510_007926 [Penicillium lagena]KAJ5611207.1 hypothetical protein N7510_007926 [Penicillium lagena]